MAVPAQGKINFPLYSVNPLSCNHVIVAGGGGAANTGVFNGFVSVFNIQLMWYNLRLHSSYASN